MNCTVLFYYITYISPILINQILAFRYMEKLQVTRSSPNQEKLVALYKKEKNSKLKERYHTLILMHELQNCTKVAEIMKKSRTTIQKWINAFNSKGIGGIILRSPPGRPSKLTEEQKAILKTDVSTHPRKLGYEFSNWEGKSISEHIKHKFGVLLKVRQCQYLLHELGFSLQRPKYAFPKADREKQEEFVQEFKKSWVLLNPKT